MCFPEIERRAKEAAEERKKLEQTSDENRQEVKTCKESLSSLNLELNVMKEQVANTESQVSFLSKELSKEVTETKKIVSHLQVQRNTSELIYVCTYSCLKDWCALFYIPTIHFMICMLRMYQCLM